MPALVDLAVTASRWVREMMSSQASVTLNSFLEARVKICFA